MPYIPNEALTREQGEQIIDVLKGEEPKEYGYPYTNEVLNKEQGDRIIKAFKIFKDGIPAIGLPDPTGLRNGTAIVAVNGEWKTQEGYGYTDAPAFEPITWDGDTEGRAFITSDVTTPIMYKVSDAFIQAEDIIGASAMTSIGSIVLSQDYVESFENAVIALYVFSGKAGEYQSENLGVDIYVPEDGTYFYNSDGVIVTALTAPSISHSIDHTLMPKGYGYYGDPAFEPITWDGNTEGREVIVEGTYCRVADAIDVSNLAGAVFSYTEYGLTPTYTIKQPDIVEIPSVAGSYYISLFDDALEIVLLSETTELGTSGIYFQVNGVPMSLTPPSSVHKFDSALIPTDPELPEVTTDDNGKFLRVVNGVWAASTVSNAGGNDF